MAESADDPRDLDWFTVLAGEVKLWILVEVSRWIFSLALVVALFGTFVVLGAFLPVPLERSIVNRDPIESLFQAFVTAIITGVTLVVTINQVVLTNKLAPIEEQRDRMAGAMQFRQDVEEALNIPVISAQPAAFLETLIDVARQKAVMLSDSTGDNLDAELRHEIDEYVEDVVGDADDAEPHLEEVEFGTFEPLFAVLEFDYSWKIHEARRLRALHDELDEEARETLDDLVEALAFFAPAREYFKTLYFQWELINLSRAILYVTPPALVVAVVMILHVSDPGALTGATFGISNTVWVVSAATAVSMLPFVVLLSFVLRIATVTKRTLAIGPFVLRETVPFREGPSDE